MKHTKNDLWTVWALSMIVSLSARADTSIPLSSPQSSDFSRQNSVILFAHTDAQGVYQSFAYEIIRIGDGRVLASIPTSFQPDKRAMEWTLEKSSGAEVYWDSAEHKVAIDEENYRFGGTTYIVDLENEKSPKILRLGRENFEKELDGNGTIEKSRIVVTDGWTPKHQLALSIAGYFKDQNGVTSRFVRTGLATIKDGAVNLQLDP